MRTASAIVEGPPSMDALCERRICEVIPVSSNERETNAPGARHEGEGLTIDELKGLKQSAIFCYTNGYQQIPFKEFKNAETWVIQKSPPKQWYQIVQKYCNTEGFFREFWLITDKHNCCPAQQTQSANNHQPCSCGHPPGEGRRTVGDQEQNMSKEGSAPFDQHEGIFRYVQGSGDFNRD